MQLLRLCNGSCNDDIICIFNLGLGRYKVALLFRIDFFFSCVRVVVVFVPFLCLVFISCCIGNVLPNPSERYFLLIDYIFAPGFDVRVKCCDFSMFSFPCVFFLGLGFYVLYFLEKKRDRERETKI